MKHFTKLFVAIAMMMVAIAANAQEKVYATFESPTNTAATWDATNKSFKWSQPTYNQIRNIGLPNGDISNYKKLVIKCDFISGDVFRILFYSGGANATIYVNKSEESNVYEFNIYDEVKKAKGDAAPDYILKCDEICLSGGGNAGEVKVYEMYLETYAPGEEKPQLVVEEEAKPAKPEGYIDFTEAFPSLKPTLEKKIGNGALVVGQRTKDVVADLSDYSKLTLVTSPNLKVVLYMNHEIDAKQNAGEYTEEEAGKYVFMDVQADENGMINIDLTQFEKRDLNCIAMPWDNDNVGTVWYLLLTKDEPVFDFNAMDVATSANGNASGDILEPLYITKGNVTMMVSPADEGASTPNRFWGTNNGPQLRMYSGTIVMDAPEGKAITKVEVINGKWGTDNAINGMFASTWEGNSTNVVINIAGNTQMNKIVVTLADKNEETTTYGDLPTAINTAKVVAAKNEVFNLAGQRLSAPMKGFNIIGGKKVLVK